MLANESDAVLLGSSILAAVAGYSIPPMMAKSSCSVKLTNLFEIGGIYSGVIEAMSKMCAAGTTIEPSDEPHVKQYHNAKYQIFLKMYEHELDLRNMMSKFP